MAIRSRERTCRILRNDAPGRVAYDALGGEAVGAVIDSLDLPDEWREYFRSGDIRYVGLEPPRGDLAVFGEYLCGLPEDAEVSCWGVGRIALQSPEGHHAGHRYWNPLADVDTVDELARYPFPDLSAVKTPERLRAEVMALQEQGFTVVGNMSQTILETAYLMRGIDRLMVDFYVRPEYVELLFTRLSEQRIVQAGLFAEAGVDAIRIGDDIATQQGLLVSPQLYRERIKPHHKAAIDVAREIIPDLHVEYHSDGRLNDLLDDLIEIGVTSINPVQPECMDLREISRQYGDRLVLWGCTAVQSTYAHGTPEDIKRETRELLERVASGHGLIIQFMNIILTPTVLRNLGAFFEQFSECGDVVE